jgi:uncharacterized protein with PIN domain
MIYAESFSDVEFDQEGGAADTKKKINEYIVQLPDGRALCLYCNKTLSEVSSALRHFKYSHKIDPNDRKFTCVMCQKSFAIKEYLNNHLRNMHNVTQAMLRDKQ